MGLVIQANRSIHEIVQMLPEQEIQHMKRVGVLVGLFTQKLYALGFFNSFSDEYQYYGQAAVYHDIGKTYIPPNILTKPGRLNEKERAIMYEHPMFAQRLFGLITSGVITGIPEHLILPAMDVAIYHHEWWNGEGYPYGIQQNMIPLVARITSICDAYDAMTSDRAYRNAHTHDYACYELEQNEGIQFDPLLTRVFLENATDIIAEIVQNPPYVKSGVR